MANEGGPEINKETGIGPVEEPWSQRGVAEAGPSNGERKDEARKSASSNSAA